MASFVAGGFSERASDEQERTVVSDRSSPGRSAWSGLVEPAEWPFHIAVIVAPHGPLDADFGPPCRLCGLIIMNDGPLRDRVCSARQDVLLAVRPDNGVHPLSGGGCVEKRRPSMGCISRQRLGASRTQGGYPHERRG